MEFREPCFLFTPFQAQEATEEIQLTQGSEYCVIQQKDAAGVFYTVNIVGIDLPDHTEQSIELMKLELLDANLYEEGAMLLPFTLKDVINCRTILAETIPSHRVVEVGMSFDIRLV